jgi:hypothetical protein
VCGATRLAHQWGCRPGLSSRFAGALCAADHTLKKVEYLCHGSARAMWCRRVRHRLRHRGEARREPSRGYADSSRHDLKGGWLLAALPQLAAAALGGQEAASALGRLLIDNSSYLQISADPRTSRIPAAVRVAPGPWCVGCPKQCSMQRSTKVTSHCSPEWVWVRGCGCTCTRPRSAIAAIGNAASSRPAAAGYS